MNPNQWAATQHFIRADAKIDGRFKVRLADGREIYSTWENDQWSVERLKPHLKVASWVRPVFIA
jgi:hypothetical protein